MTDLSADKARFSKAFDLYYSQVWSYCRRRLPESEVDDVVAEIFTTAWRRINDLPEEPLTLPWLYRTAFNVVGHSIRSRQRRTNNEQKGQRPLRLVVTPEDSVIASDQASGIAACVARLKPSDQELVRLVAWEQLSNEDIAAVLDCSTNAAAIRIHRVRERIENLLKANQVAGNSMDRQPRSTLRRKSND